MTDRADLQLRRILLALPHLADGDEHEVAALAQRLGCSEQAVLRDLHTLVTRTYEPAGFVDGVSICLDGTHVSLVTKTFLRPMRLTATEMAALDLGLAMLAAECPPDERPVLERARAAVRALRMELPGDVVEDDIRTAALPLHGDALHLRQLREAARVQRAVRLRYQRADADAEAVRDVHPYALLNAEGLWYLAAFSAAHGAVRIFRVDRVQGVEVLAEAFERPATWSADEVVHGRRVLRAEQPRTVRVRYGPAVSRWITEREGATPMADGGVEVTYPLLDTGWAVRHVLQYGADAEVVEPPDVRAEVRERLGRMAEAASALP